MAASGTLIRHGRRRGAAVQARGCVGARRGTARSSEREPRISRDAGCRAKLAMPYGAAQACMLPWSGDARLSCTGQNGGPATPRAVALWAAMEAAAGARMRALPAPALAQRDALRRCVPGPAWPWPPAGCGAAVLHAARIVYALHQHVAMHALRRFARRRAPR